MRLRDLGVGAHQGDRDRAVRGWVETFGAAVAHWATKAAERTGVDLSDLVSAGQGTTPNDMQDF